MRFTEFSGGHLEERPVHTGTFFKVQGTLKLFWWLTVAWYLTRAVHVVVSPFNLLYSFDFPVQLALDKTQQSIYD